MNAAQALMDALQPKEKPQAYDTQATVVRVDGDTLWVHIPGGVEETPVQRTIAASVGDVVQVRVADGSAWVVGNASAPPTDDKEALRAITIASDAAETARDTKATLEIKDRQIQSLVTAVDRKASTYNMGFTDISFAWETISGDAMQTKSGDDIQVHTLNPPTAGETEGITSLADGDVWYNSDEGSKAYRWNGSTWESVQDSELSEISQKLDSITLRDIGPDGQVSSIALNDQGQINLLGSVIAERLNVDALFAKDIKATGSFEVDNNTWDLTQNSNGFTLESKRSTPEGFQSASSLGVWDNMILMNGYEDTIISAGNEVVLEAPHITFSTGAPSPASSGLDFGSSVYRWGTAYVNAVNIGGYPAVAKRNKTVTGNTTANGNISLALSGDYGILSVRRTDASGVCIPYFINSEAKWYVHIISPMASYGVIASTAVTLDVDYYLK